MRCPGRKALLGTGAEITHQASSVVLDDVRPDALLSRVTVTAVPGDLGVTGPWSVTAYAVCANP